jgi:hypothetical protein
MFRCVLTVNTRDTLDIKLPLAFNGRRGRKIRPRRPPILPEPETPAGRQF